MSNDASSPYGDYVSVDALPDRHERNSLLFLLARVEVLYRTRKLPLGAAKSTTWKGRLRQARRAVEKLYALSGDLAYPADATTHAAASALAVELPAPAPKKRRRKRRKPTSSQ